jgi:hypothetical protein
MFENSGLVGFFKYCAFVNFVYILGLLMMNWEIWIIGLVGIDFFVNGD